MATIEKWKKAIKKTEVDEDEWETLNVPQFSQMTLGQFVIQNYLSEDGDVVEIDLTNRNRRGIGNFMRALNKAKTSEKTEFMLRYSSDYKKAYVKRVG